MTTEVDPTFEITVEPGDEWYAGDGAPGGLDGSTDGLGFPITIDGKSYLLDTSQSAPAPHSRRSVDLLNTQQADSGDDLAAIQPEVWRRNIESWHQGQGQARFDRKDNLPYRFNRSHNIDVWNEHHLELLHETALVQALVPGRPFLTTVGPDQLLAIVDDQAYWWTDLDLAPVNETLADSIVDLCSDGQNAYVVDEAGNILKADAAGTWAAYGTIPSFDPTRGLLRYVKGFLVAASGPSLYDMSGGIPALIFTHPLTDFTWVDTCEGLSPAYLLGGMGDRWHVYAMNINEEATTFDPPTAAAPIPEGEIGYAVGSYLGYVLIGTNQGWRFAIPAGDGSLSFGRLVETSAAVQCFEGQDRFVWYGMSSDPVEANFAGLGRADLSTFVAPLTPASASDLTTESGGDVRGVTTFGAGANSAGRRVFVVSGVGVFAEQETLAEDGWLEQGDMTFNSSNAKMALYAQVIFHESIPVGAEAYLDAKYDQQTGFTEAGNAAGGSISMGNVSLERAFNVAELRLRLVRSAVDDTAGPHVVRLEFRALNIPGRATEWVLPIMLRSELTWEGSAGVTRDVIADFNHLMELYESRKSFVLREASVPYTVHATDFQWFAQNLTEKGDAYQGVFVLTAKEIR